MEKHWSQDRPTLIFLSIKQGHSEHLHCVVKAEYNSVGSCNLSKLLTVVKLMLVAPSIFFHYWQGLCLFQQSHLSPRPLTHSSSPSLDRDSYLCNKSYFRFFAYFCLDIKIHVLIPEFSFSLPIRPCVKTQEDLEVAFKFQSYRRILFLFPQWSLPSNAMESHKCSVVFRCWWIPFEFTQFVFRWKFYFFKLTWLEKDEKKTSKCL